ncbi:hypothetical protein P9112_011469 [Eukaryota sp. TZLM1-RC]
MLPFLSVLCVLFKNHSIHVTVIFINQMKWDFPTQSIILILNPLLSDSVEDTLAELYNWDAVIQQCPKCGHETVSFFTLEFSSTQTVNSDYSHVLIVEHSTLQNPMIEITITVIKA